MTCMVIYGFKAIWIKEAISNIGDLHNDIVIPAVDLKDI